VDYGETCEAAAVREAREETGLEVVLTGLLGVYSDPARDPRGHTLSVVYTAQALNPHELIAGDDAGQALFFTLDALPPLAFDHGCIVQDFMSGLARLRP
jgi:8-oxo-dGTP diphosphatase